VTAEVLAAFIVGNWRRWTSSTLVDSWSCASEAGVMTAVEICAQNEALNAGGTLRN